MHRGSLSKLLQHKTEADQFEGCTSRGLPLRFNNVECSRSQEAHHVHILCHMEGLVGLPVNVHLSCRQIITQQSWIS
jgi:hypothetical protein